MNTVLEAHEPSARYLAALEPPLLGQFDLIASAPNGVARLRELILTLAVQGKLVAQDPNDEPASVLLERIRTEKTRLVKEGKIRKDKQLEAIAAEEKSFDLPSGWEWVRGADIYSVIRGVTYQKDEASNSPDKNLLPILRANNIRGTVNYDELIYVPKHLISAEQTLLQGDFVVCLASGSKSLVGKVAIFLGDLDCSFGAFCGAIRAISKLNYLGVFFASPLYRNAVSEASAGIGINNLKSTSLLGLTVPLPPLSEQTRIVARVEELMALCDALEAKGKLEAEQHARLVGSLLESLANSDSAHALAENWQRIATHFDQLLDRPAAVDALEQNILQLAVRGLLVSQDSADEPASELLQKIRTEKDRLIATGQLRRDKPLPPISDEEKPFELPEGWEWVTLDTLAQVGSGTTPSRDNPAYFTSGTIPWVTSGETGQTFISATAQHVTKLALGDTSLTLYPVGTLIVAMYGQGKTRGQVSELLIEATTNQACAGIVLHEQHADHRAYVKLVFEKSYDEIRELSAGGAQPNLNVGKVKATPIPLPPLSEQARIVTRVAELRTLCAQLRERLAASAQIQSRLAETSIEKAVA